MNPVEKKRIVKIWSGRVQAEYASAAISSELLHGLIRLGLSPTTLSLCHQIVADEFLHADLSRNVFLLAGGEEDAQIEIHPDQLCIQNAKNENLYVRLLDFVAEFFCCGETVAAPLFEEMLKSSKIPLVQKTLTRILKDEERHGDFGWITVEELLAFGGAEAHEYLASRIDGFISRIVTAYDTKFDVSEVEQAWGLLSGAGHHGIVKNVARKVLVPKFESLLGPLHLPFLIDLNCRDQGSHECVRAMEQ